MIYFFIMIVGILLFFFSNQFALLLFFLFAMPFNDFSFQDIPNPYTYSNNGSWYLKGSYDSERKEILDENPKGKRTAVFFIHPTTYFNRSSWNQPKENDESKKLILERNQLLIRLYKANHLLIELVLSS